MRLCVLWLQADKNQLAELRQYQQRVRLGDDVAADIVKEAARMRLEADLDAAVEVTKRRTIKRDYTDAVTKAPPPLPVPACACRLSSIF
jgi:Chloroplast envelope transporter